MANASNQDQESPYVFVVLIYSQIKPTSKAASKQARAFIISFAPSTSSSVLSPFRQTLADRATTTDELARDDMRDRSNCAMDPLAVLFCVVVCLWASRLSESVCYVRPWCSSSDQQSVIVASLSCEQLGKGITRHSFIFHTWIFHKKKKTKNLHHSFDQLFCEKPSRIISKPRAKPTSPICVFFDQSQSDRSNG